MTNTDVTAIDILIEPDAVMIHTAEALNAQLVGVYPDGFTLDSAHRPHVTIVQRYITTAHLCDAYEAVAHVLAARPVSSWSLRATGYYYLPWGDLGVAGIVVAPSDELLELQDMLLTAVEPFASRHGTAAAFVTTTNDPSINQPTIDYVRDFVELGSGTKFNPHVTIGVAPRTHLDAMIASPFSEFTFRPAGVAAYQLGNLGTAARHLHSF